MSTALHSADRYPSPPYRRMGFSANPDNFALKKRESLQQGNSLARSLCQLVNRTLFRIVETAVAEGNMNFYPNIVLKCSKILYYFPTGCYALAELIRESKLCVASPTGEGYPMERSNWSTKTSKKMNLHRKLILHLSNNSLKSG